MVGWLTALGTVFNSGRLWSIEVRLEMGTGAHKNKDLAHLLLKSVQRRKGARDCIVVFY